MAKSFISEKITSLGETDNLLLIKAFSKLNLPELAEVLQINSSVLKDNNSLEIIEKIFEIEDLTQIIKNNARELWTVEGIQQMSEELLQLPAPNFLNLFKLHSPILIYFCSKGGFTEKLFQLPDEYSLPILNAHGPALLASMANKSDFIQKLFKLPKEALLSVLEIHASSLAIASDEAQSDFFTEIFNQEKNDIGPILNIHALKLLLSCNNNVLNQFIRTLSVDYSSIFEDNIIELISNSSASVKLCIFEELFNLPAENLLRLFTKYGGKLLELSGDNREYVKNNALANSNNGVAKIFTQNALVELSLEWDDLSHLCEKYDISIPLEVLSNLNLETLEKAQILSRSPLLLPDINQATIPGMHPIMKSLVNEVEPTIHSLLAKTHLQSSLINARAQFIYKCATGLQKLIYAEEFLAKIIDNASKEEGDIIITNHPTIINLNSNALPGVDHAAGFFSNPDIFVAGENDMVSIITTLIHEATHKYIQNKFNNDVLPYFINNNNFDEITLAIEHEMQKINYKHENSWLLTMIKHYPQAEYAVELLPLFVDSITTSILTGQNFGGLSHEFTAIVWKYLHQQLFDETNPKPLPALYYFTEEVAQEGIMSIFDLSYEDNEQIEYTSSNLGEVLIP